MRKEKNIIIAVYSHPEFYPPILNLIECISPHFDHIVVLSRNVLKSEWEYPKNVTLVTVGNFQNIRASEKANVLKKILFFLNFSIHLWRLITRYNPKWIHLNDTIPLFSYSTLSHFLRFKTKVWYHNHDVVAINELRKFSIGWYAAKNEPQIFPHLDIFSLPSQDRKLFFPMSTFKGKYFFLPNLPSLKIYNQVVQKKLEGSFVKLIYQGEVGKGHGLEFLCTLVGTKIEGKIIVLHIVGNVTTTFKSLLLAHITNPEYKDYLIFHNRVAYKNLHYITNSCNVGIAILEPLGINYQTAATASNKIYEYAACSLPILYFNNEYYNTHLGKYKWALPTDLTEDALHKAITQIINNYEHLSKQARIDFEKCLNFEKNMESVLCHINCN